MLYLRLKKRKVLKTFPAFIYEKLRKQFQDTQRVPFMLDKTRIAHFFRKCRIVPKNAKGGPQKPRRGPFETFKNFRKKSQNAEKKSKGTL